jgi:tRNA A-37 threonylcarbamoyl transferase component Bud32
MTLTEMIRESERLSTLIDSGISALVQASTDMAHAEHALRKATAVAWAKAPSGTVPFKEAWVEAETADEKLAFDIAESGRYNALEAVRSRRAQLSALQSIMAAHRAEAELVHG